MGSGACCSCSGQSNLRAGEPYDSLVLIQLEDEEVRAITICESAYSLGVFGLAILAGGYEYWDNGGLHNGGLHV